MEIGKVSSSKRKGVIAWGDIRPLRRMAPNTTPTPSTPKAPPRPKSPASANPAAMAGGGSFQGPPQVSGFSDLKKLSGAALSDTEIKRRIQVEHGWTPSDADLKYARRGMGGFLRSEDPETQELLRKMRVQEHAHQEKIHIVLAQILMGDIPGALRSYMLLMERDQREYSRIVVEKLGAVREARTAVIRNFSLTSPPEIYAGTDKAMKERSEDRKSRYTQFFQMSTQTMNEMQSAERELKDALQTHARNIEQMWQKISQLQEENFRVNQRMART